MVLTWVWTRALPFLWITSPLLYQLSYRGFDARSSIFCVHVLQWSYLTICTSSRKIVLVQKFLNQYKNYLTGTKFLNRYKNKLYQRTNWTTTYTPNSEKVVIGNRQYAISKRWILIVLSRIWITNFLIISITIGKTMGITFCVLRIAYCLWLPFLN